jgi:hypothetical protein
VVPIPISKFCTLQNVLTLNSSGVSPTVQPTEFKVIFGIFIGVQKSIETIKSKVPVLPFYDSMENGKTFI